jgi:cytoskeletal protein RodZ
VAGVSVEIGNYLRQARESVGLSLDEVQEKTRIQKSFLEAIEKGDFDKLPSPFYVRTYLRSYANCVKVEPHYILREYRKREQAERYQTGQFQVSELTQQLNKLEQTGMHQFGLTGTLPKVTQNTRPTVVNRTSLHTALTIANPTKTSIGKLPNKQENVEVEQISKEKLLSSSTKSERKFPSLLPSQALTTHTQSATSRENRQTTKKESRTIAERTVPTQMYQSRLQKQQTLPLSEVKQSAQLLPSRLTKSPEPGSLSRTQETQKQTKIETKIEQQTQPETRQTNSLSRNSRFRTTSTLPTVTSKSTRDNPVINENSITKESITPERTRLSRETGGQLPVGSHENSEVRTLSRSTYRNRPTNSENFFTGRVIIASVFAVLLLSGVGWYLFSDGNKSNAGQEKTTVSPPKSQQEQLPAGGSTKHTIQGDKGNLTRESPGLYTLTGIDKVTIELEPSGVSWVQIRTGREPTSDPKKFLKDVTLREKDSTFRYIHTFSDVPDIYLSIGSPDKLKVTINGNAVDSTRIIHIVKK